MKLTAAQFSTWLKNNKLDTFKLFLLFGPDEAGISYNASQISKILMSYSESSIVRINFKDIKDNAAILMDELNAQSLFGDKKIVVLDAVPAAPGKAFLDMLKKQSWHNSLILVSEDLKPASALRKLCETEATILAVACYKEDARQLEAFIAVYLKDSGYLFDRDVPAEIAKVLPGNKMLIQNELDKLLLYKLDEKKIETDDVINVLNDGKELELDNLCTAFALRNPLIVKRELEKAEYADISPIMILRVLQKYLSRLKDITVAKEGGTSVETYIAKLMPPVFFKAKDNLVNVAKKTSSQQVLELFDAVIKLELSVKKNYSMQHVVLSFELLKKCG